MKTTSSYLVRTIATGACVLSLSACSGMSTTQQRTLSGAGIGAGVGAVGAGLTGGSPVGGAVVGGAVGAGAGYIYDQSRRH